ncbi:MAG: hypothetical protein AABY22_17035 [Nanoarchaeota archaeon]
MGKWLYEEGIRIRRFKDINVFGNYSKSPRCLDSNKDIFITRERNKYDYKLWTSIKSGKEFRYFMKDIIEKYFDGAIGEYVVHGRYITDNNYRMFFNCPVAYGEYRNNEFFITKIKSYRKIYGRGKKTSKTYKIIRLYPELLDHYRRS